MIMANAKNSQKGFVFSEVIIIIGIIGILFGLVTINLFKLQTSSSLNTTVTALVSDLKSQQLKAMVGETEGRQAADNYGIYFDFNRYVLFHGLSYTEGEPTNFKVSLDRNLQFTNITFPSSSIVFLKGSGEVLGFAAEKNTITLKSLGDNKQKTITINKYGVITGIN